MILLIDNYDSFTFNLYQYIRELSCDVKVIRNDEMGVEELESLSPSGLLLSPGPGRPEDGGISGEALLRFAGRIPILGVCLGLQIIGNRFGVPVVRSPEVMHGKVSEISHDSSGIFEGISSPLRVTRYHSLVLDREAMEGSGLVVTATAPGGVVMGARHSSCKYLEGVQFHPESILSESGREMIGNFVRWCVAPV